MFNLKTKRNKKNEETNLPDVNFKLYFHLHL